MATLWPGQKELLASAAWAVGARASIHYAEVRPIPLEAWKEHHLPLETDCSGAYTCLCYAAGLEDPNGLNYNGQGYTGTLLSHLTHVTRGEAQVGDAAVFGAYPGRHVVMLTQPGTVADPQVWSNGSEADPLYYTLDGMINYFRGLGVTTVTYLRRPQPQGSSSPPKPPAPVVERWVVRDPKSGKMLGATEHPRLWVASHWRVFHDPHPRSVHFDLGE